MKKLLSLVCFSVLATIALGGNYELYNRVKADYPSFNENLSAYTYVLDNMWIQYVDELLARAKELGKTEHIYYEEVEPYHAIVRVSKKFNTIEEQNAFLDSYDIKFSTTPYLAGDSRWSSWFPKTYNAWVELHPDYKEHNKVAIALMNRYYKTIYVDRPTPARINKIVENFINGYVISDDNLKSVFSGLVKPIRKKLREEGKSFVVGPDGKNPVQDEINKFVSKLDQPNCAGLKELVLEYYPDYEWIDPVVMTVDEVTELKNNVFIGELELTPSIKLKLKTALGLVEFNKFIDSYNGNN